MAALVCRRWHSLLTSEDSAALWEAVQLTLPPDYEQSINLNQMYSWFMRKAPHIRRLDVDLNSRSAWVAVHALLGTVGHYLTHLRIYGDEDSLWESGSTCPWLALTPNLVSLELENATDSSVEQADFPLGLTHLELTHCGEEGLYRMPDSLTRLQRLSSLGLHGSLFDNELALERIALCTSIEKLDLSNCCLERVPPALAALTHLTGLILSSNPDLGDEDGRPDALVALSTLRSLRCLELRECALAAAPAAIAHLTSLRTVLLGVNDMSGRPWLPPGPWLAGLKMLAMSDQEDFREHTPVEVLSEPLEAATALEVLRLNRNPGLRLGLPQFQALLAGKPQLQRVELSEAMLDGGIDLQQLTASFPGIAIRLVD